MKRILSPIAVAMALAGCAQDPVVNEYNYRSEIHSGVVQVRDQSYGDSDKCPKMWREADQAYKNGLPPMIGMTLKVEVVAQGKDGIEHELPMLVSAGAGNKITVKDFQVDKNLILGTETNGLVKQGDLYYYPEGYFIRAAKPDVKSNDFSLCLGIDRMSLPDSSKGDSEPTIRLDRLNILFEGERDEVKTYSFGQFDDIKVRVSVTPK